VCLTLPAGFCKQQLWPLFHYVLPMSPFSAGRFDAELWQAYVKANKVCEPHTAPGWTQNVVQCVRAAAAKMLQHQQWQQCLHIGSSTGALSLRVLLDS
jgi:hypothetical protein